MGRVGLRIPLRRVGENARSAGVETPRPAHKSEGCSYLVSRKSRFQKKIEELSCIRNQLNRSIWQLRGGSGYRPQNRSRVVHPPAPERTRATKHAVKYMRLRERSTAAAREPSCTQSAARY